MANILRLSRNVSINLNNIITAQYIQKHNRIELRTIVKGDKIIITKGEYMFDDPNRIIDDEAYDTLKARLERGDFFT